MPNRCLQGFLIGLVACCLSLLAWVSAPATALAVNNPELLPDTVTPVVDLANYLPEPHEIAK